MEVKKLLNDIATIRGQFEKEQQDNRAKFKLEKKELFDKILKLESYNKDLNDSIRERERDIKKVKKD